MSKVHGIWLSLFLGVNLLAQDQDLDVGTDDQDIIQALEFIQFQNEEEIDLTLYTDLLLEYHDNPLLLNDAALDEMEQLPLMSPILAKNLVDYIDEFGPLANLSELLRIPGFDLGYVQLLRPFVRLESKKLIVNPPAYRSKIKGKGEYNLQTRLEYPKRQGFKEPDRTYPGSPLRYYQRVNYEVPNRYKIGWIAEQDAGEAFRNAVDFNTFFFHKKNRDGLIKEIIIGDYHVHFGQDLLMAPAFALGKSLHLGSWYRSGYDLRPNTSTSEFGFRRGAALKTAFGKWTSTFFISHEFLDGNIDTLTGKVLSINQSGLHRTTSEVQKINQIRQNLAGFNFNKIHGKYEWGLGFLAHQQYAKGFRPDSTNYYQSFHAKYRLNSGLIYGELAYDHQVNEFAVLVGILTQLSGGLNFASVYRNYPSGYTNPITNAFSSSSQSQNERGIISGFELILSNHFKIAGYYDSYQKPLGTHSMPFKIHYKDAVLQFTFHKKRKWESYIRYRHKLNPYRKAITQEEKIAVSIPLAKHNIRLHNAVKVSSEWRFSQRVEFTTQNNTSGFLIYADLQWRPVESPWSLDLRYAIFDTESFNERIYAFEANLPYSFSIPAYYNRGSRKYLQLRYQGIKNTSIWLRWSVWDFEDQKTISSGQGLIDGHKKGDLALMLRYKF